MNHGMYRAPGPTGGLPFPRTGLLLATSTVLGLAAVATVMPLLLFALSAGSVAGAYQRFREGGAVMWLVLLLGLLVPLLVGGVGFFLVRGRRVPSALVLLGPAVPFAVALLGAFAGMLMVLRAISTVSIDPEQRLRILAEGVAETMACDVFGGFVGAGCAVVACAAAASATATIDVPLAAPAGAPSRAPLLAAVGLAVWLLASATLGILSFRTAGPFALLSTLVVGTLAPFVVLAARPAALLRGWHDGQEAARASGALLVAWVAALLGLILVERAVAAVAMSEALSAFAGVSVDPSQRGSILAQAVGATARVPWAIAVHVLFGTVTFALAVGPSVGRGPDGAFRHPFTLGAALGLAGAIVLLLAGAGLSRWRMRSPLDAVTQGRLSHRVGVHDVRDASRSPGMATRCGGDVRDGGRDVQHALARDRGRRRLCRACHGAAG